MYEQYVGRFVVYTLFSLSTPACLYFLAVVVQDVVEHLDQFHQEREAVVERLPLDHNGQVEDA